MNRRLVYLSRATKNLRDIAHYIGVAAGRRSIGSAYVQKLRVRCLLLADLPGIVGRPRDDLVPGLRSVPNGNYLIFFRYAGDRLEIVSIRHAARDLATFDEAASD